MTCSTVTQIKILVFFVLIGGIIPECWPKRPTLLQKNEESNERSGNPVISPSIPFVGKRQFRRRAVKGARTLQGSIYEGLRSDYLLSVTLPWTLGMFAFVILLLVCMRTDGWLYHLFTDDYVPPAIKKRMEEEARRAEGRKARMDREDNWNETRKTLETDLNVCTERVKKTMPPNTSPTPL